MPTLLEWAGGPAALRRLIDAFYDRVESDDLLGPLFPGGVSAAPYQGLNADPWKDQWSDDNP